MLLSQKDLQDLERAKHLLESKSLAMKLTEAVGKPIDLAFEQLPPALRHTIAEASKIAIEKATDLAIFTLDKKSRGKQPSKVLHRGLTFTTGFLGGFFGASALLIELPVTTTIMLRSMADIARSQGEDLTNPEVRLACVEVFALGGRETSREEAGIMGYLAIRKALEREVSKALEYIADREICSEGAPFLVRFIVTVAERFGIQVTEKVVAQLVPVIGAAGGASINWIFTTHYQNIAQGHFIIRRLERKYGRETVEKALLSLTRGRRASPAPILNSPTSPLHPKPSLGVFSPSPPQTPPSAST